MFGKSDLVDSLNRDLDRARDKRDALASGVATLTAQIAELEARLSAETERRKRERAASEIEGVKKQVRDRHLQFASVIAGLRDATEMAVSIVPETREFNELLEVIASEVAKAIDGLSGDLDQRIGALRAGLEMPQSLNRSPELTQNNDRVLRLPEWLPRIEPTKEEATEDRCSTAAA
jgi:outer membrane murein-binding lipoprotein Lpp